MNLSNLAGWNQTEFDWQLLLRIAPESCLALQYGGLLVATTTLVCYGDRLAWLGMVLTHPDYRRRGFARRLVQCALSIAEEKGVRSVKLDATEQGSPLYESLGFRREQAVERWSGAGRSSGSSICSDDGATLDLTLDHEAFGANRAALLQLLADDECLIAAEDGFLMSRPGARASFLGPCVARNPGAARRLVERCLAARDGIWFWDLLPSNCEAVQIASAFGFKPERKLVRMVKGQDARGNESMIYAGGGFEFG